MKRPEREIVLKKADSVSADSVGADSVGADSVGANFLNLGP